MTATSNSGARNGNLLVTRVQPTTSALLVLAANPNRMKATIQNLSTSVTVFLAESSSVLSTTGLELAAGATLTDEETVTAYYGITASGTSDLRVAEVAS